MKILFDHSSPFLLAHGGFQIQIEETKRALERLGIAVEYLRWWDPDQSGDIIHYFGRPSGMYIDLAHKKDFKVVMSELLTGLGARSSWAIATQRLTIRLTRRCIPTAYSAKMGWDAYTKADRIIALTTWEAQLMRRVFEAPLGRLAVIPNGVAEEFPAAARSNVERGAFLVCTATITERKRVLELARAALLARTPVWIIGKPYSETDQYAQRFFAFARQHPDIIRYEGPIESRQLMAEAYQQARGFVLLSTEESLSLSTLEAAACQCPLLLSDLPWARKVFKDSAVYCPIASTRRTAKALREFYDAAPSVKPPPKPLSWIEVAQQLQGIYEDLLSTSR